MNRQLVTKLEQLVEYEISCDGISLKDLDISFKFDLKDLTCGKPANTHKIDIDNISCRQMEFVDLQVSEDVRIVGSDICCITFTDCEFGESKDGLSSVFVETDVMEQLTFVDCTFKGTVDLLIKNVKNRIEFEDCVFEKDLIVSNLCLDKSAEISLNGEKARVKGDCTFRFCTIGGKLDIRCDIDKTLRMSEVNAGVGDKSMVQNSRLSLEGCTIQNIRFFKCNYGLVDIINAEIYNIHEQMSSFAMLQNDAPLIFRDAAIRNNDDLNVQKYSAFLYDQILTGKAEIQDKILLWLNKYSNAYGMSWLRGVVFTLVVTLILYLLLNCFGCDNPFFVFDLKFRGFWEVCLGFFSLLDIFDLADNGVKLDLTPAGRCMLLVGRIFITYGIWQTIYAFYKFRK